VNYNIFIYLVFLGYRGLPFSPCDVMKNLNSINQSINQSKTG